MPKLCPKCKTAVIQGTRRKDEDYMFDGEEWRKVGETISMWFYCENECELEESEVPQFG